MRPASIRTLALPGILTLAVAACGDAPAPAPESAAAPAGEPESAPAPSRATLASGVAGGTYHDRYASEIAQRVSGWTIEAQATDGSTENLDLLSEGAVELALAQADVFSSRISEEPAVFGLLTVVALLGEECVFVAARKGSPVEAFEDLAANVGDRAAIISIGPPGGGMAETWNHLSSVLPEQSNADLDHSGGADGLAKLVAGEVEAVAWMTDPRNTRHALLQAVQSNDELGLLDVEDERLFDILAGETDVYLPKTLPIGEDGGASVDTICTPALLMSGPSTPVGLLDALSAAGFGPL
jgi:hypothetical protein